MARPKTRLDNAAATHACNTILRTSLSLFMPTVSVIIVNYNGEELLDDCLGSLGRQTYQDFEIVFVDNGSHDNSLVRAKELCPGIRCVKLQQNTGFTGANNEGFRHATGRFIVLLNNDTESDPHFLEELVLAAERRAEIGMVAPKILNFYDREEIDSVGGLVLCPDGIGQGRGRGEKDRAQYDGLDDILIPSGCAALYRRAMLDQVGLFDERFFAYCEDTSIPKFAVPADLQLLSLSTDGVCGTDGKRKRAGAKQRPTALGVDHGTPSGSCGYTRVPAATLAVKKS